MRNRSVSWGGPICSRDAGSVEESSFLGRVTSSPSARQASLGSPGGRYSLPFGTVQEKKWTLLPLIQEVEVDR